ncbi:M14 family zinc carboxypeptidase [Spirosoma rhododendri]|uniref:Peptidase M14 n=1 Tax=Spirosoma rhododendri TaxID=2728024 RepID=A0A7L5DI22_9BACT|nr:M14 family zinc carboxypeptidase [Spirosoma rhododendri]QJD77996.1 peptidase M14 [Spirosoma rhododendri]
MATTRSASAQDMARRLYDAHETYKQQALTHRRFKHRDMVPLLDSLRGPGPLAISQVGESLEKRAIYQVKAGTGPVNVLLWSQMHGDEATATMALFDLFNFLTASGDEFDSLRQTILTKLTLYAVPMLNPDGAERFQRRTASDIDMNRDALRLQTPEGRLLKSLQQSLKPLVGFNLHDQNPRYSVGHSGQQAVMSFLATAYNPARSVNDVRRRSMQLIAGMNRALQQFIPGQIARYDDEFEPRAFGDNIQKWGTTLVLIESGGYKGDSEKMMIRQLNFVAILTALQSIAEETYAQENTDDYAAIPENGRNLFDVLIRNATTIRNGKPVRVDVGINRYEVNTDSARSYKYKSTVEDLGDLSTFSGLEEIDATGLTLTAAGVQNYMTASADELQQLNLDSLREAGVLLIRTSAAGRAVLAGQPVHLLRDGKIPARPLQLGQIPTFLLKDGDRIRYWFVNGFWYADAAGAGWERSAVTE